MEPVLSKTEAGSAVSALRAVRKTARSKDVQADLQAGFFVGSPYVIDLTDGCLRQVLITEQPVPVIDVMRKGRLMFQLGMNVAHKTSAISLFSNLKGSDEPLSSEEMGHISESLLHIQYNDPSLSSHVFARASSFKIHTVKNSYQEMLEATAFDRSLLALCGFVSFTHDDNLRTVNCDDALVEHNWSYEQFRALFHFIPPEKRESFYREFKDMYAAYSPKKKECILSMKTDIKNIEESVMRLKKQGLTIDDMSASLELARKQLRMQKSPIAKVTLDKLFASTQDLPYVSNVAPMHNVFSAIRRLPTSLHAVVNLRYSENILTYEVVEPKENYFSRRDLLGL